LTRFIDRGAIVAGWIGLGTAIVLVVAFALVVPIQPIVYIAALPAGLLIGWYANNKSERYRPRARAIANALWAGLLTALTLGIFYVSVRLLFIYADTGYPDFNVAETPTQTASPTCATGPECTYLRYVNEGKGPELEEAGITNGDEFAQFVLSETLAAGATLFALALSGAAIAGAWQAIRPVPAPVLKAGPSST
jgi:hypothetical protein